MFSTYDPKSEISRFNQHRSNEPFVASQEFAAVVRRALDLAKRTGGAFDPTIGPLSRLYGFGPDGKTPKVEPTADALAEARKHTGWQRLDFAPPGDLRKQIPTLELDLNAIAKGAGVDVVADIEAAMPEEPGEAEEVDLDFVAEHMTEAEVFVKYGLVDRALSDERSRRARGNSHAGDFRVGALDRPLRRLGQ